jgi:hypothetical protein
MPNNKRPGIQGSQNYKFFCFESGDNGELVVFPYQVKQVTFFHKLRIKKQDFPKE